MSTETLTENGENSPQPEPGRLTLARLDEMPLAPGIRTIDADLEVIAPMDVADLPNIKGAIGYLLGTISERQRQFFNGTIYSIVALGLCLLKAEALHLLKAQAETVSGKSRKRNDAGQLQAAAGEGFTAWLGENFPDLNERTARNYRNAARNAGLTSDHTLADVEELRETRALHEKRPTDLYRLADDPNKPPPPPPAAPISLVQTNFAALSLALDQMLILRESMSAEESEAHWVKLSATLEAFTGSRWHMEGTGDGEHGELTAKPAKAAKKGARK